ncbi:MAG: hypothetical protein K8F91_01145, partial [Candidatus Obscuribacterales bacterium]|nr:hypothetical protein [Candidatus Obscuribacterales bacterium]
VLDWVHGEESAQIKQAPEEFKDDLKRLDKLGIVYKRNNRSLGIRWQRLRKIVERNNHGMSVPFEHDRVLEYFSGPSLLIN